LLDITRKIGFPSHENALVEGRVFAACVLRDLMEQIFVQICSVKGTPAA